MLIIIIIIIMITSLSNLSSSSTRERSIKNQIWLLWIFTSASLRFPGFNERMTYLTLPTIIIILVGLFITITTIIRSSWSSPSSWLTSTWILGHHHLNTSPPRTSLPSSRRPWPSPSSSIIITTSMIDFRLRRPKNFFFHRVFILTSGAKYVRRHQTTSFSVLVICWRQEWSTFKISWWWYWWYYVISWWYFGDHICDIMVIICVILGNEWKCELTAPRISSQPLMPLRASSTLPPSSSSPSKMETEVSTS